MSFIFLRIVAPALGPVATADSRLLIAAVALAAWSHMTGFDPHWRRWWKQYAIVGLINNAAPFLLFAFAALHITAGEMAVLNATSPMWAAVMGAAFLGDRLSGRRVLGLTAGVAGVALVTGSTADSTSLVGVAAGLGGAVCYGYVGIYLRRWAPDVPAKGLAVGTQICATLMLLPLVAVSPPAAAPSLFVIGCMLALGLVCGAVAYVLYYRLIADVGATGALTVTYLVPFFAMLWGGLFLGEPVTPAMLGGTALVILGTVFVLGGAK